jgi:hypothetical protein
MGDLIQMQRPVTSAQAQIDAAYPRSRRVRDAMKFIRNMAAQGPIAFEATQSRHVGPTFGLEPSLIRRMKARLRCELSFGGEGK